MEKKEYSAVYRANRKYEKNNYYCVNIRFPKEWKEEIVSRSEGKIQRYIIDCVAKDLGKEYNPKDLIKEKKEGKKRKEEI